MTVHLLASVLVLAASNPKPQAPRITDDEVRERVEAYLGAIDTPVQPEQWRALGPRAQPILESIAGSAQSLPTRRAKAIDGLAQLGDGRAQVLLTRLARGEQEPLVVRLSAVRGLGHLLPPGKLVPALRPVLEGSKDARVRGLAADTLSLRAGRESCVAVKAQSEREDEIGKGHYAQALFRCGDDHPSPRE